MNMKDKAELLAGLGMYLDSISIIDSIEMACQVGETDVTQPGSVFREFALNDTATITIKINGGAQRRDERSGVLFHKGNREEEA